MVTSSDPDIATGEALPPPPPPEVVRRRRMSPVWMAVTVVAGLLLVGLISSMFVYVPYYGIAPGDVRDTVPLITSNDAELYDAEGKLLYITVSVRRMTAFGAVIGWLDPDIDVVPERQVLGDQTPRENREAGLRVMGASKDVAEYVALTRLGYDVGVNGGGAVITAVAEGVPASSVLARGDVIVSIDGTPISLVSQVSEALAGHKPGDTVELGLTDDVGEHPRTVTVELAARPSDGGPIIGVTLDQSDSVVFDFPIDLQIDSGRVGGPSAGLAFTLAAMDALTPGELTGGHKVAATGTMLMDGRVGPIGGLRQKTVAVDVANADVFLVPTSELAVAQAQAPDNLQVIGVDTLDDALAALSALGGNTDALAAPGAGSS